MTKSLTLLACVLVLAGVGAARAQDVGAGEKVFAQCRACHQIGPNAKNAVGPELNGVIGRKAGTVEGYTYSPSNKNSGLTWDDATFTTYIKNPQGVVKGTKMSFAGVKDDQKVKDLLAYLKQFDGKGNKTP